MTFISLVIVLLLVQWWGSGKPLHRDQWFFNGWQRLPHANARLGRGPWLCVLAVAAPVVLLAALVIYIALCSSELWLLLINIPVLLYSLGRGDYAGALHTYTEQEWRDRQQAAPDSPECLGGSKAEQGQG